MKVFRSKLFAKAMSDANYSPYSLAKEMGKYVSSITGSGIGMWLRGTIPSGVSLHVACNILGVSYESMFTEMSRSERTSARSSRDGRSKRRTKKQQQEIQSKLEYATRELARVCEKLSRLEE